MNKFWKTNYKNIDSKEKFISEIRNRFYDCKYKIVKCAILYNSENFDYDRNYYKQTQMINFIRFGKKIFNIKESMFDILNIPSFIKEISKYVSEKGVTHRSYNISFDGHCFKSAVEFDFYLVLKEINLVKVLEVNKRYPKNNNKIKFFDFKIEYNEKIYYIELCSNNDKNSNYYKNITEKLNLYYNLNIILIDINKIKDFIEHLNKTLEMKNFYETN